MLVEATYINGDPTVRSIRSPVNFTSLIADLAIMMKLDLVMMDLELEVAIKHCVGCIGWNYLVARAEVEGEFYAEY